MKQILFFVLLLLNPACFSADSDYMATDKIQLFFYDENGKLSDTERLIFNPEQVRLSLRMDIEQITQAKVRDVSSDKRTCRGIYLFPPLSSPSAIASFSLDPKANMKKSNYIFIYRAPRIIVNFISK